LARDLKDQRPKEVHGRKFVEPRTRVEARVEVDELSDDRIRRPKVPLGAPKPSGAVCGVRRFNHCSRHSWSSVIVTLSCPLE
jgi:hypothetical protein